MAETKLPLVSLSVATCHIYKRGIYEYYHTLFPDIETTDVIRNTENKQVKRNMGRYYQQKRLLLRCIHFVHHVNSDLINNMDHMRILGIEPS